MPSSSSILTLALAATLVQSQQPLYAQCGGIGYTGATTCASGSTCTIVNPYYSQCLPGSAPSSTLSTITTTSRAPVPPTSTTSRTTSVRPTTTNPSLPSGTAGAGPGTALQSGYFWIRAVEDPNFHKYLQSVPDFAAGVAVLDAPSGAGQFNVVDGQLVELADAAKGTLLYANVAQPAETGQRTLAVTFSTSKNTFGTFAFQGDTLTWSVPSITRPNTAAWLVCGNQELFINTGAYLYQTPAGCADETIHSYGGSTATE